MAFDPKTVFDLHPDAEEIYVVKDMPFLKKRDADGYATTETRLDPEHPTVPVKYLRSEVYPAKKASTQVADAPVDKAEKGK